MNRFWELIMVGFLSGLTSGDGLLPGLFHAQKRSVFNQCSEEPESGCSSEEFTEVNSGQSIAGEPVRLHFSHQRDFCYQPFDLELSSDDDKAVIIYTTDCSCPGRNNGKFYRNKIRIDSTTVIRAIAYSGKDSSEQITQSFLFPASVIRQPASPAGFPEFWGGSKVIPADYEMDPQVINNSAYSGVVLEAFKSVPALSLTMPVKEWFDPVNGIYIGYPNSVITHEKAVTAEFIFNGRKPDFAVSCGVQNQGGTSIVDWKVPKQSMRLLFKKEYGPGKLSCRLFPDSSIDSVNTLVLDAFLYSWIHPWDDKQRLTTLYFRDQLCSDLQNKMGWLSFHGIYINLFINGLYWGMYDLHERPDEAFLAAYLEGGREDFDVIKHNPNNVINGTNAWYLEMLDVARRGLAGEAGLKTIQKYLDLPAFIDYMILNFFLGNYDWAHQNYYAARNHTKATGFRFYTWDAEHVMRYSDVNYDNTAKNDKGGPTEIHTLLKVNPEYRIQFADAVYRHLFNNGALSNDSFAARFRYRKNEIDMAVVLESARWGDYLEKTTGITYTRNDHWLPEVERVMKDYIPKRRDIFIRQLQNPVNNLFPKYMPPEFREENQGTGKGKLVSLLNPNSAAGDVYFTVDGADPRLKGGLVRGKKYTDPVMVDKTAILKARFLSKADAVWSALAESIYLFSDKYGEKIMISEIMYHPDNDYPEFVELLNGGDTPVNLKGFILSGGIAFPFADDCLVQPGAGIVLSNDTVLFKNRYKFTAFGQYRRKLDNSGETLLLTNLFNQRIDSVTYGILQPWPVIPSGGGYSIQLSDPGLDNSLPVNWKLSDRESGDPYDAGRKLKAKARIYPNPVKDYATLEMSDPSHGFTRLRVEVFSRYGNRVKLTETESYNSKARLFLGDLAPGLYVIRLTPLNEMQYGSFTLKVVKLD